MKRLVFIFITVLLFVGCSGQNLNTAEINQIKNEVQESINIVEKSFTNNKLLEEDKIKLETLREKYTDILFNAEWDKKEDMQFLLGVNEMLEKTIVYFTVNQSKENKTGALQSVEKIKQQFK